MAIYHFKAKVGKRAYSHLKYILREDKYKSRNDLEFQGSFNLPKEFKDIKYFWQKAIQNERANANIYREYEISLPKELDKEENKKILESFLKKQFKENYIYNYAIHNPRNEQPHAHVMFCERILDGKDRTPDEFFKRFSKKKDGTITGGAKKNNIFANKEYLKFVRKDWETHLNKFLESYGLEKVSCETLKNQRDEALKNKDYIKAELLNRKATGTFLNSKIKNNTLNEEEKQEYNYRKEEQKIEEEIKKEQRYENFYNDYKEESEKQKEKSFKEILDEKERLENEIFKIHKKLAPKRSRENVYGILSNGKISKLKNEKRALFKKIKNTKNKSEKQKYKNQIKEIDKQIDSIKNSFNEETVINQELKMRKKYVNTLKFLNNKLRIIDKIFIERLKNLDKDDKENLKYYEAYINRKDMREDKENLKNDIKTNKQKIKMHVSLGNYKKVYNLKNTNRNLREDVKLCDTILKKLQREQKINEQNIKYGEFTLDEYRYTNFEKYLEDLELKGK